MEKNSMDDESAKRIQTKLKFVKSEETGAYIGFISKNPKTGRICGVRQDSPFPKKICILDKKLILETLLNVLYDVTLIPMAEKNGYVVIEAKPVEFKTTITTLYVPKALYIVELKFGNKVIRFDPHCGRKDSIKKLDECLNVVSKRVDIKNLSQVLEDFAIAGHELLKKFKQDGFYTKAS
jgi:hypothetical protein